MAISKQNQIKLIGQCLQFCNNTQSQENYDCKLKNKNHLQLKSLFKTCVLLYNLTIFKIFYFYYCTCDHCLFFVFNCIHLCWASYTSELVLSESQELKKASCHKMCIQQLNKKLMKEIYTTRLIPELLLLLNPSEY